MESHTSIKDERKTLKEIIPYTGSLSYSFQNKLGAVYWFRLLFFGFIVHHWFCPSCRQKRVVEFGEWLCANVLKRVPHRHFVFSIPKILRRYSLYDRKPLHDLSRCAWESLKDFLQGIAHEKNSVPGAVIAIRTFGDLLGFNAHCHILITDGCFCGKGMLRVAPLLELKKLETLFRYKIFLCGLPGNPALCSLRQAAGHTPDVTIILILHWGNGILKI